jgi:hypothetical protein
MYGLNPYLPSRLALHKLFRSLFSHCGLLFSQSRRFRPDSVAHPRNLRNKRDPAILSCWEASAHSGRLARLSRSQTHLDLIPSGKSI